MKKLLLIFSLIAGWIGASAQTYCTSSLYTSGCSFGDNIDDVTIGGFSHTGTGCGTDNYEDYTATPIPLIMSQNYYPISATTGYSGQYMGVWVDWNDDGDFDDAGEFVANSTTTHAPGTPFVDSILIDNTRPIGVHRLRMRDLWLSQLTASDACAVLGYGETHDYTIEVLPDIVGGCANQFTNWGIDSILDVSAKVNWTPGTGNTSWYLEYGVAGFVPGSAAGTKLTGTYPSATQPPVYLSGLSANTQYDVYFGEICNSALDTAYFGSPQTFTTTVSCPAPLGLTAAATSSNSGTASWTSLLATSYEVIIDTAGFDPALYGTSTTTSITSINFTSLNSNTAYDVYVIGNCGTGGFSDTAGPVSFRTPCVVATAPFNENFDGSDWIAGSAGQNANSSISPCWTRSPDMAVPTDFQMGPHTNAPSSGTGPTSDLTGGNFIYGEASYGGSGDIANLISPPIDVSGLTTPGLYFFQHRYGGGGSIADMYVEISNDLGVSWDTVYSVTGETQSAIAAPWSLEFVNLVAYTGDTIMVKFAQKSNGCCGDAAIDSVVVDEAPTCPWPTALTMTSRTDSSVVVTWNDATGTNWDLQWGPPGFTQASPNTGTKSTSTNPDTITGLQSDTDYEIYVRSNCGPNGVSIWTGPILIRTSCSPFTAPYTTNFDNSPANAVPFCWSANITGGRTTNGVAQTYTFGTPFSAPNHIRFYNGSPAGPADTTLFISPKFSDLPAGDKRIQFMANASTTATNELVVGTMADPMDILSFHALDTIALVNGYQLYLVNLNLAAGYNGTDEYVAFRHGNSNTFMTIYIDDFTYEVIPLCNPPLSNTLGVSGASATTASIYWGSGSDGDETHWEVGSVGFVPGTNSALAADSVAGNVDTVIVSGLSAQTCYEFYIKDSCAFNGFSPWVGPFTFCTPCLSQAMPYYESFDIFKPACWDSVGGQWFWTPFQGPGSDVYAEANFWGQSTGQAVLTSPPISISVDAQVRFDWSHLYSSTYPDDELMVRASVAGTGVWDTILSLKGPVNFNDPSAGNSNTPGNFITEDVILDPSVFTGNDVIIELRAITDFGPDLFVNDFHVEAAPSCPKLIGLDADAVTDSSAILDWTMAPSAASYEVWFGPQGFYQGTATVGGVQASTTGDSLVVDTLSSNTCYEFLVRSICGPGDTSLWTGPYSFCTDCSPFTAPYYTGFDNMATDVTPDCWASYFTGGTGTFAAFEVYSFATPVTFPNHVRFYNYNQDTTMGISPMFSDLTAGNKRIRFQALVSSTATPNTIIVGTVSGPSEGHTFSPIDTIALTNTYTEYTAEFTTANGYNGTDSYIALLHGNEATFRTYYIDEFNYEVIPSCFRPDSLSVSAITTNTADLDWVNNVASTGTSFVVSYGAGITSPAAGTKQAVTGNSVTLSSLATATSYCAYVAEVCSPGDTSLWRGPICFTTNCVPFNTPYYQSYDIWPLVCWTNTGGSQSWVQNATYAEAEFWTYNGDSMVLNSPIINISGDSRIRYKWSHLYSSAYPGDRLDVRVSIVGQSGYVTLDSKIGSTFNDPTAGNTTPGSFIEDTLVLDPAIYNGQAIRVHLVAISDWGPDLFINDFYVEEVSVGCPAPTNVAANVIACDSIEVTWNGAGDSTAVVYGSTGMTPTTGGLVLNDSAYYITGTMPNSSYDVYVANICGADTSIVAGPVTFNTGATGAPAASFTGSPAGAGSLTYNFDASATTGNGNTYTWDYGDTAAAAGSGVTSAYTYGAGGSYTVKLVVTNACGSDSITITFADVSLGENILSQSLKLYPNPAADVLNVELNLEGNSEVSVRILDMSGKQVMAVTKDKKEKLMTESIDISNLAKGIYMIEVSDSKYTAVRRLVKE